MISIGTAACTALASCDLPPGARIAPSFADIFANNSAKNGFLAVPLPEEDVGRIMQRATDEIGYQITIDLERKRVHDEHGLSAPFEMDAFIRHCLLNGLDDIGLTLQHEAEIAAYEKSHPAPTSLNSR